MLQVKQGDVIEKFVKLPLMSVWAMVEVLKIVKRQDKSFVIIKRVIIKDMKDRVM